MTPTTVDYNRNNFFDCDVTKEGTSRGFIFSFSLIYHMMMMYSEVIPTKCPQFFVVESP